MAHHIITGVMLVLVAVAAAASVMVINHIFKNRDPQDRDIAGKL